MRKIQIAKPYIDKDDVSGVVEVLKSGWLSLGPKYQEFEQNLAKYVGSKYACSVSSGTAALHLGVRALGLKAGDEVVTSPFSFVASSNCLLYENVKPVFVDIEEETFNMNPTLIEKAITKKTKAILPVHIFGQSAEMDEIMEIARRHNLQILEDSCESLGATYKGKMVGTTGDIGTYAFYPNKQMTTGEGGMVVTNSKEIYDLCDSMRNQGRNKNGDWLIHERLGYNYRMDEMSASLGITQLEKLDWMIEEKRKIAAWYNTALENIPDVEVPTVGENRTHSWFVYVIRVKNGKRNKASLSLRDKLMDKLTRRGVQTKPYLPVIHLQPFMQKLFNFKQGDFPIAEKISEETLALPLYIGLKLEDIDYIVDGIRTILYG